MRRARENSDSQKAWVLGKYYYLLRTSLLRVLIRNSTFMNTIHPQVVADLHCQSRFPLQTQVPVSFDASILHLHLRFSHGQCHACLVFDDLQECEKSKSGCG